MKNSKPALHRSLSTVVAAFLFVFAMPSCALDFTCTRIVNELKDEALRGTLLSLKASPADCVVARLNGLISIGDGSKVAGILAANRYLMYLDLDSPGGSVADAILLGRAIRRQNYMTFVNEADNCASACFLIWIAGVYRHASSGNLLIHRFYSTDPRIVQLDSQGLAEQYRSQTKAIVEYLDFMEVGGEAGAIADKMLRTPPNEALAFQSESHPHSFGYIPSRDQWFRHRCGNSYSKRSDCVVGAIVRERLSM